MKVMMVRISMMNQLKMDWMRAIYLKILLEKGLSWESLHFSWIAVVFLMKKKYHRSLIGLGRLNIKFMAHNKRKKKGSFTMIRIIPMKKGSNFMLMKMVIMMNILMIKQKKEKWIMKQVKINKDNLSIKRNNNI